MHASTCPLLWWWYEEFMVWSISSCLQYCLNWSDIKLMPASDNFFSSLNSVNMIFAALIRSSTDNPSALFTTGNLL